MKKKRTLFGYILLFAGTLMLLTGCRKQPAGPFDPNTDDYLKASTQIDFDLSTLSAIPDNPYPSLSVPTYVTKVKDTYFIVDCYHNQVIYNDNLTEPLYEWQIMTNDLSLPHTIASDGTLYVIDDTENNRILVMEEGVNENGQDCFIPTQEFTQVGDRPHYILYNEATATFYVWSSESGEMYLFRRAEGDTRLYLTQILSIPSLDGVYVRSFTIDGDDIYFVSGNASILKASLYDLSIEEEYPVPDTMAGMVQLSFIGDNCYITVSTDSTGNQDYATIVRVKELSDLTNGNYEDIYSTYFVGGGTPYYISKIEDTYYLTEHRLPGHSIWSFHVTGENEITDVMTIY